MSEATETVSSRSPVNIAKSFKEIQQTFRYSRPMMGRSGEPSPSPPSSLPTLWNLPYVLHKSRPARSCPSTKSLVPNRPDCVEPHRLKELPHLESLINVLLIRDPVSWEESSVVMEIDVSPGVGQQAEDARAAGEAGSMHGGAAIIAWMVWICAGSQE